MDRPQQQSLPPRAGDTKTMQREMELLRKQIAFEARRREDIMRVLAQERAVPPVPSDHVAALERREEEAAQLRGEVTSMKMFLQKGVSEAKRLASLADSLRVSLDEWKHTSDDLLADQKRLTETMHDLEKELESSKGAVLRESEVNSDGESSIRRLLSGAEESMRDVEGHRQEVKRMEGQIAELHVIHRQLERTELGANNLAAAVRRTHHELSKLQPLVQQGISSTTTNVAGATAVSDPLRRGDSEDPVDDERSDYDSGEDAEPSTNVQVTCNNAKAHVAKCEASLSTLHSALSRFETDERQRLLSARRQHADILEQMKCEVKELKARSEHHLQTMRQQLVHKEPLLQTYAEVRAKAMERNAQRVLSEKFDGSVPLEKPFQLLEFLEGENRMLAAEGRKLREAHEKLVAKCASRAMDFEAVRQLRHTYRDLETKKTLLSIDLRQAEEEGRRLKLELWESSAAASVVALSPGSSKSAAVARAARGNASGRAESVSSSAARPPWRTTAMD